MLNQTMNKRVVITGLGLITPVGLNVKSSWDNIVQGVSGIKLLQHLILPNLHAKLQDY